MGETRGLEAHIIAEFDTWRRGRLPEEWDYKRYSSPFIEFGSGAEISYGKLLNLEIHVGNTTETYIEEGRFTPARLRLVAIQNLEKEKWGDGHCNYVDFFTEELYQHPDGAWYRTPGSPLPFSSTVRDLLPVSKAKRLLKRNTAVLRELDERIAALAEMREKLRG